jgi:hypothetical protein
MHKNRKKRRKKADNLDLVTFDTNSCMILEKSLDLRRSETSNFFLPFPSTISVKTLGNSEIEQNF